MQHGSLLLLQLITVTEDLPKSILQLVTVIVYLAKSILQLVTVAVELPKSISCSRFNHSIVPVPIIESKIPKWVVLAFLIAYI